MVDASLITHQTYLSIWRKMDMIQSSQIFL